MKQKIITVTKENLVLEVLDSNASEPVLSRDTIAWQSGELKDSLEKLLELESSNLGKRAPIRILLADDFYYLIGLELDKSLENDRYAIKNLAEAVIPENLEEVKWDYGVVGKEEDLVFVQCFALVKDFDLELAQVIKELSLKVDVIEPYALAVMSSFESNKPNFLLLHKDDLVTMVLVVKNGVVVFSKSIDLSSSDNGLDSLSSFNSSKLLLSGVTKELVKDFSKSLEVVEVSIYANLNLLEKKLIRGKDSKVLNLDEDSGPVESDNTKISSNSRFYLILLVVSILGVVVGFFAVNLYR